MGVEGAPEYFGLDPDGFEEPPTTAFAGERHVQQPEVIEMETLLHDNLLVNSSTF